MSLPVRFSLSTNLQVPPVTRRILLPLLAFVLLPALAFAKDYPAKKYPSSSAYPAPNYAAPVKDYPDLVSVGLGMYNPTKDAKRESLDYRVEYRWGVSILPHLSDSFNSVEPLFQVHPLLGIQGNTRGAFYGSGGLVMDIPFSEMGIVSWSETVGGFIQGHDPVNMGTVFQFRSQIELGARFENGMRVTGYFSHTSNAGLGSRNPGAEAAGVYFHVPVSSFGL